MRRGLALAVVGSLAAPAAAHGILTSPVPRPNSIGQGTKLQPFGDARNQANRGCGGQNNQDPGVQLPTISYRPGDIVRVQWRLTIPHPADNLDTGVRVAIHYRPGDSFDNNILQGGVEGDPNFPTNPTVNAVAAGNPNSAANELMSTIVTLPAGKTCNFCTIQWIWAAREDNGFYMYCADISITQDGLLPTNLQALYASEAGRELPENDPSAGGPGGTGGGNGGSGGDDGGGGSVAAIVVPLLLVLAAGGGYYYYKQQQGGDSAVSVPKPPPSRPAGGGPQLPPGWTAATDPASGRTYYTNAATGETSWEPPMAPVPGGSGLPPGWTENKDGSGNTYYVNSATGQSTWERPTNRF